MKKVIYVFFVCTILIGITVFFYLNIEKANNITGIVYGIYDKYFGEEVEPYTEEYIINDLVEINDSFYYNKLTDNQKIIYTCIANGVKDLNIDINLKGYEYENDTILSQDVEEALYKFLLDHPEVFYINEKYTICTNTSILGNRINLKFEYMVSSKEELNNKISEIDKEIDIIFSNINENMSDFEKELILHDYVANNTEYYSYENLEDIPRECHNIYGTLIDKKAVCDGFAKTMKLLLDKNNIENIIVTGSLKKESHAWNMIKLNNEWYNLDLTSNKSIKTEEKDYTIHSYFNITDDLIYKTHKFDEKDILPIAANEEQNYYLKKGKIINEDENFSEKFTKLIQENKGEIFEFRCDINNVPDKISNALSYKNYNSGYVDKKSSKFSYYNVLNSYVLLKLY